MIVGKYINGIFTQVKVENGKEITRKKNKRTEEELYLDGYKKVCLMNKSDENDIEEGLEYPTCFLQNGISQTINNIEEL